MRAAKGEGMENVCPAPARGKLECNVSLGPIPSKLRRFTTFQGSVGYFYAARSRKQALCLAGRERRASMLSLMSVFAKDESGTAMVEYGVIAAGICLAIALVIFQIGGQLSTTFETLAPAVGPH
jgi:Flp pilus assembly pilin Flp